MLLKYGVKTTTKKLHQIQLLSHFLEAIFFKIKYTYKVHKVETVPSKQFMDSVLVTFSVKPASTDWRFSFSPI